MSAFFISHKAEADLRDIRSFTIERWGKEAARRYLRQLQGTFLRLADHPMRARQLGRFQLADSVGQEAQSVRDPHSRGLSARADPFAT